MKKLSILLVAFGFYAGTHASVNQEQSTAAQHAREAGSEAYTAAQKAGGEAYDTAKETVGNIQQKTGQAWENLKKQASAWWQKLTGDTTGAYGAACPGDYSTYDTTTDAESMAATTDAAGTTADASGTAGYATQV